MRRKRKLSSQTDFVRPQNRLVVYRFGEAGTFHRPLMSREQHKGDNQKDREKTLWTLKGNQKKKTIQVFFSFSWVSQSRSIWQTWGKGGRLGLSVMVENKRTGTTQKHFAGDFYQISKNGSPVGKGKKQDPKAVLTVLLLVLEKKVDGSWYRAGFFLLPLTVRLSEWGGGWGGGLLFSQVTVHMRITTCIEFKQWST